MQNNDPSAFTRFIPGFEFLQNLSQSAANPSGMQMPNFSNWIAPTLDPEELEKRITELKNVQFWLDQNARALAATVQALEVQKMTLSTLKGMQFNLGDMANFFNPAASAPSASSNSATPPPASEKTDDASTSNASTASTTGNAGHTVDPLQFWNALTQQFQQIATQTLQDTAQAASAFAAAPAGPKASASTSSRPRSAPAKKPAAKKASPAKTAPRAAAKVASQSASKAPSKATAKAKPRSR